jgi:DNA-binding response OmpR family regulator
MSKLSTTFRTTLSFLESAQSTITELDAGAIKPLSKAELDAAVKLVLLCDTVAARFRQDDDELDSAEIEGELILLCENADEIHGEAI